MSAFGVVLVGLGVLMVWSGVKGQKLSDVLHSFYNAEPVKPAAAGRSDIVQPDLSGVLASMPVTPSTRSYA